MNTSRALLAGMALMVVAAVASAQVGLEVTVSTDKATYIRWEPITITVSMHNPTDQTIELYSSNSCTTGYVMDNVYLVPGPICLQVIIETSIGPGETRTHQFHHSWSEYALEVGTHSVWGHSFGYRSAPVTFEVVDAPPPPGDVLIDFETIPGGAPLDGAPLATAYEAWGVSFTSTYPVVAATWDGVNHYATVTRADYPPGAHIIADLDVPACAAKVDVSSATGVTVTMLAKDADGEVVASAVSAPCVHPEFQGPLTVKAARPIYRLEWWPSEPTAAVSIDNLFLARRPRRCGDADLDGKVDLDDFSRFRNGFGLRSGATWGDGDFDGDGDVDLDDFILLKQNFGS